MKTFRSFFSGSLAALAVLLLLLGSAGQAQAAKEYLVQCFGDSLTEGTYPGYLYGMLTNNISQYDWDIEDRGHSGYTASQIYSRMVRESARNAYPDIVILMAGTNDIVRNATGDIDRVVGATKTYIFYAVDYISWENDSARPRLIVSAIPPSTWGDFNEMAQEYNDQLEYDLQIYGVDVFVKSNYTDFVDPSTGSARTDRYANYLHPNDQGYQDMAYNFYEAIDALFNKSKYADNSDYTIMPNFKALP